MEEFIFNLFNSSETPFAILFIVLFVFYYRDNKQREQRFNEQLDSIRSEIQDQIQGIKTDLTVIMTVWKTLIDHELERRRK